jgi:hypothetical protein
MSQMALDYVMEKRAILIAENAAVDVRLTEDVFFTPIAAIFPWQVCARKPRSLVALRANSKGSMLSPF